MMHRNLSWRVQEQMTEHLWLITDGDTTAVFVTGEDESLGWHERIEVSTPTGCMTGTIVEVSKQQTLAYFLQQHSPLKESQTVELLYLVLDAFAEETAEKQRCDAHTRIAPLSMAYIDGKLAAIAGVGTQITQLPTEMTLLIDACGFHNDTVPPHLPEPSKEFRELLAVLQKPCVNLEKWLSDFQNTLDACPHRAPLPTTQSTLPDMIVDSIRRSIDSAESQAVATEYHRGVEQPAEKSQVKATGAMTSKLRDSNRQAVRSRRRKTRTGWQKLRSAWPYLAGACGFLLAVALVAGLSYATGDKENSEQDNIEKQAQVAPENSQPPTHSTTHEHATETVLAALEELNATRARALEEGDTDAVNGLSLPGSPSHKAEDAEVNKSFVGAEITIETHSTAVTRLETTRAVISATVITEVKRDGAATWQDEQAVTFELRLDQGQWKMYQVQQT